MVSRTLAKIAIIVHKQGNAWFNLRSVLQRLVKFILFLQSISFLGRNVENVKKCDFYYSSRLFLAGMAGLITITK